MIEVIAFIHDNYLEMLRSIVYLWAALESLALFQLYLYGYQGIKRSKIILTLTLVFLWMGITFMFLFLVPIIRIANDAQYMIFTRLSPLVVVPLALLLNRFRHISTKEDGLGK